MKHDFNIIVNADMPSVSKEGFGTIAVLDIKHDIDYQVIYDFEDFELKLEDGEQKDTEVYKTLQTIFSQKPAPRKVIVRGIKGKTQVDVIKDIRENTDDFFFIVSSEKPTDLVETIKYVETLEKVYIGSTEDVAELASLATTGYENTAMFFDNHEAASALPVVMSFNVGGKTAHAKPLVAVEPSEISGAVYDQVKEANSNVYIRRNHKNRVVGGKVLNGQWLDIVLGKYWIKFTLEQRLDDLITNVDKIPYNNRGVGMIAGVVSTVMSEAIDRGIIDEFKVDAKDVNEISASEKSTRIYNYLTVTGYLQGAIHGGDITINLVYKEAEIDE